MGMPYVPTRTMLGTDYVEPRYYPQPHGFLGDQKFKIVESPFPHERAGLLRLQGLLPDVDPYHLWTNALVVEGAETIVTYQPLDPTTLDYSATYSRAYVNGTWQAATLLGDGNGVAYASGRGEFVLKIADGLIHLLTV